MRITLDITKKSLDRLAYSPPLLWPPFCALVNYRIPMPVTELMVFPDCMGQPSFYACPRCGVTMEREYMRFCDRCGQRLDWRGCENAKIVYPYVHNRSDL